MNCSNCGTISSPTGTTCGVCGLVNTPARPTARPPARSPQASPSPPRPRQPPTPRPQSIGRRHSNGPTQTPGSAGHGPLQVVSGTVASPPNTTPNRTGLIPRALLWIAGLLVALVLLPVLVPLLILVAIPLLVVWVIGRWLGLGPVGAAVLGHGAMSLSGRNRSHPTDGGVSARVRETTGTIHQVVFPGHAGDIELGDQLRVVGIARRGRLEALRIDNHTTGVRLWRPRLLATTVLLGAGAFITLVALLG